MYRGFVLFYFAQNIKINNKRKIHILIMIDEIYCSQFVITRGNTLYGEIAVKEIKE